MIGKYSRILQSNNNEYKAKGNNYANLWQTISSGNNWQVFFENRKNGDIYPSHFKIQDSAGIKNASNEALIEDNR